MIPVVRTVVAMKPVAPLLTDQRRTVIEPSLHSEITRVCDEREESGDDNRITLPSIPTAEMLRLATPYPPPDDESSLATLAPPPISAVDELGDEGTDGAAGRHAPSGIPGPPRLPRIAV